ncbi:MAG: hypothetical protein KatS3mg110_0274 [Pirellulaceae bacterium]|nr:MAG: hypothetical protein KatS3mg110_0274 [Pirellulaceae bacterium]
MAHLAWNDAEPAATTFKSQQRWGAGLWIALGLAVVVGQLMRVRSDLGGTPLLSANDRSRWSTIRSLVDHGTYAVDQVVLRPDGKRDREWYSIDMVKHPGPDGKEHFYSSKPPLFPTLVAGLYWVFRTLTGATLGEQPFYVVRSLLLIVNVVPLAGYWYLAAKLGQRWCRTEWEFGYLMAAVTLGTLLTPFAVTLNNHLPAAVGAAFAGWFVLRIVTGVSCRWYDFAGAGLAAGWAAVNELPALLFLVMVGWVCLRRSTGLTLTAFLPPVLAWFVAFEACNFVAHGSWIPPYMHRSDGPVLAVGEIDPPEDATPGKCRKH